MENIICPHCKEVSTIEEWNDKTNDINLGGITTIEDARMEGALGSYIYHCPMCENSILGNYLEFIEQEEEVEDVSTDIEGSILGVSEEEFMNEFLPWLESKGWAFFGFTKDG